MPIEDREDYVDLVAQAVIDRIEERDRLAGLVDMVVNRVIALQKAQAEAEQDRNTVEQDSNTTQETHDAGEPIGERNSSY